MLEKLVGVGSVCEVSKPVVNKVFIVFRRRGEGGEEKEEIARFSMSVIRISARATVRGDPIGPPVTCL